MTFAELKNRWNWKPIRHCPGRFVLSMSDFSGPPGELAGLDSGATLSKVDTAKDPVVVVPLDNGGLISYKKPDGAYLHTLNTADGFERKLNQLGIFGLHRS